MVNKNRYWWSGQYNLCEVMYLSRFLIFILLNDKELKRSMHIVHVCLLCTHFVGLTISFITAALLVNPRNFVTVCSSMQWTIVKISGIMLQKSNSVILVASNTNYQVTHGRPRHVNLFVKRVSKRSQIDNLILHTFKGFNLTTLGSFFSSTICFRTLWTKLPCILVYIFVVYQ